MRDETLHTTRQSDSAASARRGSVLILVAGILVLLVIIASAYLSRTNSERTQAVAVRDGSQRDSRVGTIETDLQNIITEALFLQPIDVNDPLFESDGIADANFPRLPIRPGAIRYENARVKPLELVALYYGPPYQVVPWTNWPDVLGRDGFDDIQGNPGTTDTRWLSSSEPVRYFNAGFQFPHGPDTFAHTSDDVDVWSHWSHMTNIATANNGYRIVRDISDITNVSGSGGVVQNLNIPVEQFVPNIPTDMFTPANGQVFFFDPADIDDFVARWQNWFIENGLDPGVGYRLAYQDPTRIPPNLLLLNDCAFDADGNGTNTRLEPGERPQDEFIQGTARWNISRFLSDSDGDGRTDSFWFLAPTMSENGIRQIVSVRIIDNNAMINLNSATQFLRGNPNTTGDGTVGRTPSDVALFESNSDFPDEIFGVGFFTNIENTEEAFPPQLPSDDPTSPFGDFALEFDPNRWEGAPQTTSPGTFLGELGDGLNAFSSIFLTNQLNRLDYWRRAGSHPLTPSSDTTGLFGVEYTPFTLSDEIELRMYNGQNLPWSASRLEGAIQPVNSGFGGQFLRGSIGREETTEYLDQLGIQPLVWPFDELLHDNRHRITLFNGARNELMAPWLRWEGQLGRWGAPAFPTSPPVQTFFNQSRLKLDLREDPRFLRDIANGAQPGSDDLIALDGRFTFEDRLPWAVLLALSTRDAITPANVGSYYFFDDSFDNNIRRTQRLSAGLAANIHAYRDDNYDPDTDEPNDPGEDYTHLENRFDFVPVPVIGGGVPDSIGSFEADVRMMGLEKQPFLVEAFLGHLYESTRVAPPGYTNTGENLVFSEGYLNTLVAIEIGNPFGTPLKLSDASGQSWFRLKVFASDGNPVGTYNLTGQIPAGEARVLLSTNGEDETAWRNAFHITPSELDAANDADKRESFGYQLIPDGELHTDRADYDDGNEERAIELYRLVPASEGGPLVEVLIDRVDIHANDGLMVTDSDRANQFQFGAEVINLEEPEDWPPDAIPPPNSGNAFPGISIDSDDRWIQHVDLRRGWWPGVFDAGSNNTMPRILDSEKSPRYIWASRAIEQEEQSFSTMELPAIWLGQSQDERPIRFHTKRKEVENNDLLPRIKNDDHSMQMLLKNADFEQVGEVLNVFCFGHQLRYTGGVFDPMGEDGGTILTFSEFMIQPRLVGESDVRQGRLRTSPREFPAAPDIPDTEVGRVIGFYANDGTTVDSYTPALPAGLRVLDLFVCDGPGFNARYTDSDGNGAFGEEIDYALLRYDNAPVEWRQVNNGVWVPFGRATPGMINLNTASPEVMRALPHGYDFVHRTGNIEDQNGNAFTLPPSEQATRTRWVESAISYRNKWEDGTPSEVVPEYADRGVNTGDFTDFIPDMRLEPGFASPAELNLLIKPGDTMAGGPDADLRDDSYSIEFARMNPLRVNSNFPVSFPVDVDASTDVNNIFDITSNSFLFDEVHGDSEEGSLLYRGVSNIATTTSDVFTVYFRVRSFRQNPTTRIWDATDPEYIVDESRYVMTVDRSNVNSPGDKPRILFTEKIEK